MSRAKIHLLMNVDDVISRLKNSLNITTDKQLAKLFDISDQNFLNQKKSKTILIRAINLALHYKMNMNWLIYGEENPLSASGKPSVEFGMAISSGNEKNAIESRVATLERQVAKLENKKGRVQYKKVVSPDADNDNSVE